MTIKELVAKDNKVRFVFYRDGVMWYEVLAPNGEYSNAFNPQYAAVFRFPVPISDCGNGTFLAEDRAITYMRYIRKQLEETEREMKEFEEYSNKQRCCGGACDNEKI